MQELIAHYDALIDENNDPVHDPAPLRDYMDKWDGKPFIDRLHLNGKERVLEIGVGTGRLARRVAPLCNTFCGIDISPKTVARAAENLSSQANVTLLCGDFLTFAFGEAFDVIYSSLTFMHIENKSEAIRKVASLLRQNGRFVLSISKDPSDSLDMGTRKLRLYPDSPEKISAALKQAALFMIDRTETEFAHIFVAEKRA